MYKYILIVVAAALAGFGAYAQTTGTFKDRRDGKTYKTVKIDTKVWMAENLNYAAEGSKCYENSADSCAKYGRLYNWATALKACPAGFRLPSDDEWTALVNYAGGEDKAGKKLKSKAGWNNNGNGTDDYGWSALPGGFGNSGGSFYDAGDDGNWWSATEGDAGDARYRNMNYNNESVGWDGSDKTNLFSVRCVADKYQKVNQLGKSDKSANTEGPVPAPDNEANNEYIPEGFRFFSEMYGDLNGDTRDDYVMIIKNKKTNRRGMLIFLDVGHSDETAFENRSCFAPEHDGTYLSMDIRDGNLIIHYDDLKQRGVWWQYTVRYRNNNFELIGFDEENTSPFYESSSINFLTKKMLTRNQPNASNGIVKEVWNDIDIKTSLKINELFKRTHLAGFDDLNAKIFSARGWSGIIDIKIKR